jgi:hypothetical protein
MEFSLIATDPLPVDVRPDILDWLTAIGTVGAVAVAVGVAIVEAVRAHSARSERDAVLEAQRASEYRAVARLVSAWVERSYVRAEDGTHYVEVAFAHIINESDLPVFQVRASISLSSAVPHGSKPITLGPLSIRAIQWQLSLNPPAGRRRRAICDQLPTLTSPA